MPTKTNSERAPVWEAAEAVRDKKGQDIVLLDLGEVAGFTDHFLICHGSSGRQVHAIADEVDRRLGLAGMRAAHVEGYQNAEWVLMDYVDFVVHIFAEKARSFYDLERLWRTAPRLSLDAEPAPRAASSS
jgi:ribosome-associated protein